MLASIRYKILVQQHKNRIYSYALFMLKNRMDADDVTQEVLIRTWKNIDNFNINSAKSWMMKTTHNLCLDYLRKRKIMSEREYDADDNFADHYKGDDKLNNPEIAARRELLKQRIQESVDKLPEALKIIFVMYEMQGLKYKEISEILNVPLNSVKVYLMRARKKLQEELREYIHEEVA